jgi:hypothetical protein
MAEYSGLAYQTQTGPPGSGQSFCHGFFLTTLPLPSTPHTHNQSNPVLPHVPITYHEYFIYLQNVKKDNLLLHK